MSNDIDTEKSSTLENNNVNQRILFEMQISGFFNDLPPPDDEEEAYHQDDEHRKETSGWSGLSNLLGFSTSVRKEPTLPPIWTFRCECYACSRKP